jgi:hypothetical protein
MAVANKRGLSSPEEEIMGNRQIIDELGRTAAELKAARLASQRMRAYWKGGGAALNGWVPFKEPPSEQLRTRAESQLAFALWQVSWRSLPVAPSGPLISRFLPRAR